MSRGWPSSQQLSMVPSWTLYSRLSHSGQQLAYIPMQTSVNSDLVSRCSKAWQQHCLCLMHSQIAPCALYIAFLLALFVTGCAFAHALHILHFPFNVHCVVVYEMVLQCGDTCQLSPGTEFTFKAVLYTKQCFCISKSLCISYF